MAPKPETTIVLDCGAVVDADDLSLLEGRRWYINSQGYAFSRMKSPGARHIWMHRFLLDAKEGEMVDHINGNRSDNRRVNLRLCESRSNARNQTTARRDNTSGYKGVSYDKRRGKWQVTIAAGELSPSGFRRNKFLGYVEDPVEGARIYDAAARTYFGEFARCNFET